MNAEELYQIVKDVPSEAWPSGMRMHTAVWLVETKIPTVETATAFRFVPTDHACLMFEASMTRWLLAKCAEQGSEMHAQQGSWNLGNFRVRCVFREKMGVTLIEALAAACKEVEHEGQ